LHRLSASTTIHWTENQNEYFGLEIEMAFAWNAAQAFHSVRGKTRFPSETLEKLGEVRRKKRHSVAGKPHQILNAYGLRSLWNIGMAQRRITHAKQHYLELPGRNILFTKMFTLADSKQSVTSVTSSSARPLAANQSAFN
jgi:hypothetical protein